MLSVDYAGAAAAAGSKLSIEYGRLVDGLLRVGRRSQQNRMDDRGLRSGGWPGLCILRIVESKNARALLTLRWTSRTGSPG